MEWEVKERIRGESNRKLRGKGGEWRRWWRGICRGTATDMVRSDGRQEWGGRTFNGGEGRSTTELAGMSEIGRAHV